MSDECKGVDYGQERKDVQQMLRMLVKDKSISRKTADRALWLYDKGGTLHWSNTETGMLAKHRPAVRYRLTVTFDNPLTLP